MAESFEELPREIQLLYQLALSVGRTLDVQRNCAEFVSLLLAHKDIGYASVWVRSAVLHDTATPETAELIYAVPRARAVDTKIPLSHPMAEWLGDRLFAYATSDRAEYAALILERNAEQGAVALFRLGEIGWLKLYSRRDRAVHWRSLAQLWNVVEKFAIALEGALAHERMASEVESRKRAEERAARVLCEREAITEAIPDILYMFDSEGRMVWWNARVREVTGLSDAELFGRPASAFFDEADRGRVRSAFEHALLTGRSEVDARLITSAGKRLYHVTGVRLRRGSSRERCVVGSGRDISERKAAEERRQNLERQMQNAQKLESLGILAGGIAHDFNNLLVGILGNASLVLSDLPETSKAHAALKDIETAARRAADLCGQMLAYSGSGTFQVEEVDLRVVLDELTPLLEVSMSKKVTLRTEHPEDLPPVEVDVTQVRQIVMNLMTNASEAFGDEVGSIHLSTGCVDVGAEELPRAGSELSAGRYAYVEVRDTGCGMSEEVRGRIFDPFFTTKFTGRGLGLAAVLGIVRGHGGDIEVESTAGRGTRFRVMFPASEGTLVPQPAPRVRAAETEHTGTILVVDDEEVVRHVIANMLARGGYKTLAAEDGIRGVETFARHVHEIDAVLLDMTMPRVSGEEALRRMRAIDPTIPVILSSGFNEQDTRKRVEGMEPTAFVQKPFGMETLLATVREALEQRTLRGSLTGSSPP